MSNQITSLRHTVQALSNGYTGRYTAQFADGTVETDTVAMSWGMDRRTPSVPGTSGQWTRVSETTALSGIDRFRELEAAARAAGIAVVWGA